MRFIVMHKLDRNSEAGVPPSGDLLAAMGAFLAEGAAAGVFQSGEGLHSSSKRVRLNFLSGRCTLTNGPFTGSNELIAGFAMIKVKSQDEAVQWAKRIAEALGEGEIEVGPVKEPWDLGLGPKPEGAPLRFLLLRKADRQSEGGVPGPPNREAEMERVVDQMRRAGVLLCAEELEPSSKSARLRLSGDKRTVVDGPFAESKELIGGYAIIQVPSKAEAIEWASAFARVLSSANVEGDIEIDIRPIA
jgi:hypothetical protein